MENMMHSSGGDISPNSTGPLFHPKRGKLIFLGRFWIVLTVIFMVLLPKGGIKVGSIPLTWGYLFLSLSAALIVIFGLLPGKVRLPARSLLGYLPTVPFALFSSVSVLFVGTNSPGLTIALFVVTTVFPVIFLLVVAPWLQDAGNLDLVLATLRRCVFLAAVYGIFVFGFFTVTKKAVEVPYLTVNAADQNSLLKKDNRRGEFQKLVSTYNNGNIYAVSILMLLPLYCLLEKRVWRQWLVKASIVLTLSRTAWFGLFICEVLMLVFQQRKRPKTIVFTMFGMIFAAVLVVFFLNTMGRDVSWLADSSLGGRQGQLSVLDDLRFLPYLPFDGITEMLPMSILQTFGVLGFLFFAMAMVSPLLGALTTKDRSPLLVSATLGCAGYYAVSLSDGAFLLIPVMAFFWFLAALIWARPSMENPGS